MNDEIREPEWPKEAGDPRALGRRDLTPPAELEDRVTGELLRRGLIVPGAAAGKRGGLARGLLAAAASVMLLVVGFAAGRQTAPEASPEPSPAAAGEAATKYALLLYETDDYRRATGAETLNRYREYSVWVAEARRRGQFVTGEDLAVAEGRVLSPGAAAEGTPTTTPGVALEDAAALSGVFLITATDYAHAVELAESLPHLRHGGHVVVQEVVPTEQPPRIEPQVG